MIGTVWYLNPIDAVLVLKCGTYIRLYLGATSVVDLTTPNWILLDNAKLQGQVSRLSNVTQWLVKNSTRPPGRCPMADLEKGKLAMEQKEGTLNNSLGEVIANAR